MLLHQSECIGVNCEGTRSIRRDIKIKKEEGKHWNRVCVCVRSRGDGLRGEERIIDTEIISLFHSNLHRLRTKVLYERCTFTRDGDERVLEETRAHRYERLPTHTRRPPMRRNTLKHTHTISPILWCCKLHKTNKCLTAAPLAWYSRSCLTKIAAV